MKKHFLQNFKGILFVLFSLIIIPAFAVPDLTIVGFFEAEGGIGKVPITILETLDNEFSVNFVCTTSRPNLGNELTPKALACMENPDQAAGKVAMLTELIWSQGGKPADKVPKGSIVKLAYSMLETTKIPSPWVQILNDEFDAVVVPDIYVSRMYQESGVIIPIFVVPLPMILEPYYARTINRSISPKPFIFADTSANKNPAVLIEAFAKAFKNDPNIILYLRAGCLDRKRINAAIKKYKLSMVVLEDGKIPLSQFIDRLLQFNCFINLSRGEGFSYIPRESLSLGLPVIITDNTASGTICKSGLVRAIPSNIKAPANQHYMNLFAEQCGDQFDCKVEDVVKALKDVYNNYPKYLEKAQNGREWVRQYDCRNPNLKARYCALIKPKQIIFGNENAVTEDGCLITNSKDLYGKYLQVLDSN